EGMIQQADDYVTKPFSARELLARVSAHLEMARVRRQASEQMQRLKRLVDSNIIGIVTADLSGIKGANDLFLGMIGASREELEAGRVDWMKSTPAEHMEKDLRALDE